VGKTIPQGAAIVYRPGLSATARLHFVQASAGIDQWGDRSLLVPVVDDVSSDVWQGAETSDDAPELEREPEAGARFANLPTELSRPKQYAQLTTALKNHLYRDGRLALWKCDEFNEISKPGESQGDFRARMAHKLVERRDADIEKMRASYASKLAASKERERKAQQRVVREKTQASHETMQTAWSIGTTILGALMGRRSYRSASTSMRSAGRAVEQRQDVAQAQETVEAIHQQLADMEAECEAKMEQVRQAADPEKLQLEAFSLQPRKGDLSVTRVALAWTPWYQASSGAFERAW
jgi:hypothetical protein